MSDSRGRLSPRRHPLWEYLDLATLACTKHLDGISVFRQRQSVADGAIGIKQAVCEELSRPLEAVQNGHRPGNRDLLVVDPIGLDSHSGGIGRDAELKERTTRTDSADAVLDGRLVAGCVYHQLPALGALELVGTRRGCGTAEPPCLSESLGVDVHDVDRHGTGTFRQLEHHQTHSSRSVDENVGAKL